MHTAVHQLTTQRYTSLLPSVLPGTTSYQMFTLPYQWDNQRNNQLNNQLNNQGLPIACFITVLYMDTIVDIGTLVPISYFLVKPL